MASREGEAGLQQYNDRGSEGVGLGGGPCRPEVTKWSFRGHSAASVRSPRTEGVGKSSAIGGWCRG